VRAAARVDRPVAEAIEIRRKRLLFRSWHRGTRELDLLLGPFAERHLSSFSGPELDRYEALLACEDARLFDWVARGEVPPPDLDGEMLRRLRDFRP